MRETTSGTNVQRRLLDHQHRRNPCQLFGLVWLLEFPWLLLQPLLALVQLGRAGLNLDNASFVAGGCFVDWITFNPVSYASAPRLSKARRAAALHGPPAQSTELSTFRCGRIDPDDVLLFIIANYNYWIHRVVLSTALFLTIEDFWNKMLFV